MGGGVDVETERGWSGWRRFCDGGEVGLETERGQSVCGEPCPASAHADSAVHRTSARNAAWPLPLANSQAGTWDRHDPARGDQG
ncbi:hypothetical protein SKAU_G00364440 [Synaphobranchus kaupii]|uniref:Uncharacterized protein n=1 Tax=Synaphobranchus kaupii TaxID=118154 RepID=A0A9Q1EES8_SYNKA|nr:hypothetical protein SKAU_G00364440 [Synaphobranchus kaupii]